MPNSRSRIRIAAVPQRDREAHPALAIADPEQAVLAPAVRPAARVIVGQVAPALAGGRVVLAHRAPLALGEVRAPAPPVVHAPHVLGEPFTLCVVARCRHVRPNVPYVPTDTQVLHEVPRRARRTLTAPPALRQ